MSSHDFILIRWWRHFRESLAAPKGYLVIGSLLAAYLTIYAVAEGIHSRQIARSDYERSAVVSKLIANNGTAFVVGMRQFGATYHLQVLRSPVVWNPLSWWQSDHPNRQILRDLIEDLFEAARQDSMNCNPDWDAASELILFGRSSKVFIAKANLEEVDFSAFDLSQVRFSQSSLRGADLREANLRFCRVTDTDVARANLTDVSANHAYFLNVDFRETPSLKRVINAKSAKFPGCDFSGLDLSQVDFGGAEFGALLDNVPAARFDGTNLTAAFLKHADFSAVDLSTATLTDAQLQGAYYNGETRFPDDFNPVAAGMRRLPDD